MKVNAVRIFHEQSIFKHPGDTKSYWHQDQFFWPLDTKLHIGMWMPLIDCTKDMGIMRFVKNSHTMGDLMGISINEKSEDHYDKIIEEKKLEVIELDSIDAGDCTFHFGWTIHGAGLNKSNKIREARLNKKRSRKNNIRKVKVRVKKIEEADAQPVDQ